MLKWHSVALTAIAAALAMGSAQAAVVGSFDPGFPFIANGAPTNNLGYRGTITLDLSAGCAGASGYILTDPNQANYSGCSITPLSATIDYYNATLHTPPTPADILVHTNLTAADIYSTPASAYVYGAYFDPVSGNLLAFDSRQSNNIYVSVTDTSVAAAQIHYNEGAIAGYPPSFPDHLNLSFQSNFTFQRIAADSFATPSAAAAPAATGPAGAVVPTALLIDTNARGGTVTSNPAVVRISPINPTAVPEPESAALALIGFAALAVARRRRSTKAGRRAVGVPPLD